MTEISKLIMKSNQLKGKHILIWTGILTPVMLVISIFFMGGGHGTYFFGKLFYPIPMIISGIHDRITDLAVWIALLQIPVYGLILSLVRNKNWKIVGFGIMIIHIILFLTAMIIASGFN